ncbi:ABC transporter ATP-binding protein [Candidatus Saccharibacteria bacterium]|nr:ABC transporter ATP-binding protein [Candidatus Saccharibacteria bacterium]
MAGKKQKFLVGRTMHYFWSAQWRHKALVITTFLTTPLVILWRDVISTYLIADIIAKITANPSLDYAIQNILPEAIIIILLRVFFSVFLGELRVWCHWKMEIYAIYYLSNLCFDTVCAQSMQFHNNRFSGSLVSQVNKFVSAYERFMDELVWNIIPVFVSIIASLAILFVRIPVFAAVLVVLIVAYIIIAYLAFKKIAPLNLNLADSENKRTGQLADSISNIISVKSYANEKHEQKRFQKFSTKTMNATTTLLNAEIKRNIGFDFVYAGITAVVLVFFITGQGIFGVSLATLILVFQYTNNISSYLWNFNSIFKSMNRIFGDSTEMVEILDMKDDVVDAKNAKELKVKSGAVDFKNITFQHQESKSPIFKDFSLSIKPGERIGLVGVSGSGKTTLTKLLLRFADVSAGEITIDGQNIKDVTQNSLRSQIAYVPQETSLFHRSIAENIAYAKPSATKDEIIQAAKLANAHEFIESLPEGYDTLVGERGVKLSGGQRQRIAIARAILKDAPILVLDEATSALDSESEALIQSALTRLMRGRTAIVIAHRLSTIADLDSIVVLSEGKIAEQGTHATLLANKSGQYHKLWSRQSGAFFGEK